MTNGPREPHPYFDVRFEPGVRPLSFERLDEDPVPLHERSPRGMPSVRPLSFDEPEHACSRAGEAAGVDAPEPRESNLIEITMQGYVEGFAKGRDEGREAGREEIRVAVGHLLQVAETVRQHRGETVAAIEDELIDLALRIAERVLHAEVSARGEEVAGRLAELALARLGECAHMTVRMHPEDLRRLALETSTRAGAVSYAADPALARGDAVVSSEKGRIDARLCAQLDELRAELAAREGDATPAPLADGAKEPW